MYCVLCHLGELCDGTIEGGSKPEAKYAYHCIAKKLCDAGLITFQNEEAEEPFVAGEERFEVPPPQPPTGKDKVRRALARSLARSCQLFWARARLQEAEEKMDRLPLVEAKKKRVEAAYKYHDEMMDEMQSDWVYLEQCKVRFFQKKKYVKKKGTDVPEKAAAKKRKEAKKRKGGHGSRFGATKKARGGGGGNSSEDMDT